MQRTIYFGVGSESYKNNICYIVWWPNSNYGPDNVYATDDAQCCLLTLSKLIFLSRYHIDVFTCIICMIPKFKLLHTRMRRLLIVFFVLTTITKLDYIIRQFMTKQLISCCVIENAISCISFPLLRSFPFPMILLCLFQIQCYFFQSNLNIFFLKLTFYFVFFSISGIIELTIWWIS